MTPAERRVVEELNKVDGSVAHVAKALGTSESYIHRIKRDHWQPVDKTLEPTSSLVPAANATAITHLLPPDIDGVKGLRDKTLQVLDRTLDTYMTTDIPALIDLKEVNKLLRTILQYEGALRQQVTPALNIFQDNRQQHTYKINALVEELKQLSPSALRAFAGVPEPVVIDVEGKPVLTGEV